MLHQGATSGYTGVVTETDYQAETEMSTTHDHPFDITCCPLMSAEVHLGLIAECERIATAGDPDPDGPYSIRRTSSYAEITITETGKKIRTASEFPFLLIADGKIVARAETKAAIIKRSEKRHYTSPGLVVVMREGE